jgi:transglutaminase-like putative cysteine protease
MFRKSFFGFILIVLFYTPSAIGSPPDWVTECIVGSDTLSYPTEVPAVLLYLSSSLTVTGRETMTGHYRTCTKVLSRNGRGWAKLSRSIDEHTLPSNLKGWLIRPGESPRELSRKYADPSWYDPPSDFEKDITISAEFPDTQTGDIVAFEYDLNFISYPDAPQKFLRSEIQTFLPILYRKVEFTLWRGQTLRWKSTQTGFPAPSRNGNHFQWELRDLPPRPVETAMPPRGFDETAIATLISDSTNQVLTTNDEWKTVSSSGKLLMDLGLIDNDKIRALAHNLTDSVPGSAAKAAAIAEFVNHHIHYAEDANRNSGYTPERADKTLSIGRGDCKGKVALMQSLLAVLNIPSTPVLASWQWPVFYELPCISQFDHCIVAIPRNSLDSSWDLSFATSDGWTYYDPSCAEVPFGFIPPPVSGCKALRMSQSDSSLVVLPSNSPEQFREDYLWDARITPLGDITGQFTAIRKTMAATTARRRIAEISVPGRMAELRTIFDSAMSGQLILDYRSTDSAGAFVESFTVKGRASARDSMGRFIVNLVPIRQSFVYYLETPHRAHPIWFGYPWSQTISATWRMKPGLVLSTLPEDTSTVSSLGSAEGSIHFTDSTVSLNLSTVFSGGIETPERANSISRFIATFNNFYHNKALLRPGKKK